MSDDELNKIIKESLVEAELELSDNGKELNIVCDYKNGNNNDSFDYSQQIDNNNFTDDDLQRRNRLSDLCGVS